MSFIHDVEPAEVRERKVKSQNEVSWFSRSVMQKKKKKFPQISFFIYLFALFCLDYHFFLIDLSNRKTCTRIKK